jgi:glycerate kinase
MCAPDSFKGSMTATAAAEAMIAGIRKAAPDTIVDCCPIADGGEGTLEALTSALAGDFHRVTVSGPLGDPVETAFATFAEGRLAVIESAAAIGLQLVPERLRDPAKTSSYGVGELIAAACATVPKKIIVAVGGSATNDGGCGMAQALGIRFFDRNDNEIRTPIGGGRLSDLARIDAAARLSALSNIEMIVACDVQNPLTGKDGATHVYGPQKGASGEQLALLDQGLAHLAGLIRRDLKMDIEELPGSGAAGGLGGGLVAFTGATVSSGIETVLDAVEFDRRVSACDLCLTGEGRIDAQSVAGKACMGVARAANKHGVPTIALVGQVGSGAEQCLAAGLHDYVVIGDGLPAEESMRRAEELIADTAGHVVRNYLALPGSEPGSDPGGVLNPR